MATTSKLETIPDLNDGARLNSVEFERRYVASTHVRKAELIEGVVHVASPVSATHGKPHAALTQWLGFYQMRTPYIECMIDGTVRLDDRNQVQPDIILMIDPDHGGRASLSVDQYIEGSPELVVEISVSTKAIDLHQKLEAYRRNSIPEYIVWRVLDHAIDWFILRDSRYHRLQPEPDGILRSEVFPGLWLDPDALIRGDLSALFQVMQLGLASRTHADFVMRLANSGSVEGERP